MLTSCSKIKAFKVSNLNIQRERMSFEVKQWYCYSHVENIIEANFPVRFPLYKVADQSDLIVFPNHLLRDAVINVVQICSVIFIGMM